MSKQRNEAHRMPPFGRTIIEVAEGEEVRGRRGKMVVRTGEVVTEGATIWATPTDAARLRAAAGL